MSDYEDGWQAGTAYGEERSASAITALEAQVKELRDSLWDCIAIIRKDLEGPEQVKRVLKCALELAPGYGDENDPELAALASQEPK